MSTISIPRISNEEATNKGFSGHTREDRPTYGETKLRRELEKAKEEIALLRGSLTSSHDTIRDLANIAGMPEIAEDLFVPERLV